MNKIQIDGLFFKQSDIQDILKCPACKSVFDDPRILPCGDSICFGCLILIKDRNNNENFICPECGDLLLIKESNNLPVNKILKKQLNLEAKEVYRNEFVEELKKNLQILYKQTNELDNILQNPATIVQEWSKNLKNHLELEKEKIVSNINEIFDDYYAKIKLFEKFYLTDLTHELFDQVSASINVRVQNANKFFNYQENRLKEFNASIEETKEALKTIEDHILYMQSNSDLIKSLIFKGRVIEFIENKELLTKNWIFGKLLNSCVMKDLPKMNKKTLFKFEILGFEIFDIKILNEKSIILLTEGNATKDLNTFVLEQINDTGAVNQIRRYFPQFSCDRAKLKIVSFNNNAILFAKRNDSAFMLGNLCRKEFIDFKSNTNFLDCKSIISTSINKTNYYAILKDLEDKNHLIIFNHNLERINILGARNKGEPYYFSDDIQQFIVDEDHLYFLERNQLKMMNLFTGIVQKEYDIFGTTFSIYKSKAFMVYNENALQTFIYYDLFGNELYRVDMSEMKNCRKCFLTNCKIACLNDQNDILIYE